MVVHIGYKEQDDRLNVNGSSWPWLVSARPHQVLSDDLREGPQLLETKSSPRGTLEAPK